MMMRFLCISLLLLSVAAAMNIYSGTCRYDWAFVYETGYTPRPLTANEKSLLINYGMQYAEYVSQMTRGVNFSPVPPTMPCFCHNCN